MTGDVSERTNLGDFVLRLVPFLSLGIHFRGDEFHLQTRFGDFRLLVGIEFRRFETSWRERQTNAGPSRVSRTQLPLEVVPCLPGRGSER